MKVRKLLSVFLVPKSIRTLKYKHSVKRKLITHLLQDYGWAKSMDKDECIDRSGKPIPWFSYPAIDFLSQLNCTDKEVFEYGCGFSTLYWGARAKSVFSVESDLKWIEKIKSKMPVNCKLIPSSLNVEEYSGKISSFLQQFDIIVIDGYIKTRVACCEKALRQLKPGGIIILDNSDRCLHSAAVLRNAGLIQCDFTGFAPLSAHAQTTSIFFSRDYNFLPINDYQPHKSVAQPFMPYPNG
ncbi:MAG: class I SAM-dependent methyltransferase [Bacteroidota bacterium]|nr:class I SAM-dependent methyltransferase [Bacteroidota bacterium]